MKQSTCKEFEVFDFKEDEDDVPVNYRHWSKLSNPKSEDPAITKYQFLEYASTASVAQMKEGRTVDHVHVVAIDDDDALISEITRGSLDSLDNAGSERPGSCGVISGRSFEQTCHFMEDNFNTKSFSPGMEIKVSSHLRSSPANGFFSSTIPESPCSNGSGDASTSDGHDSIQESSPSTPASPLNENDVPTDVRALDQAIGGLEMEEMDAIVLHTDYATYCDHYFPASLILMSQNTIRMKVTDLEDESGALKLEWDVGDILSIESQWSSVANVAQVKLHLVTKDVVHTENSHGTSDVQVLEFVVYDPCWSQRQELIMSLDVKYKAAWSIELNRKNCDGDASPAESSGSSDPYIPNFEESFEEVIYPKGDVDAVSISKRDVDLLQPDTFINDTIIDFYIKYLKNEMRPEERHRSHFFNSFFFRKLADLDKNPSSAFDSKAAFQRVRKWTRKVNLFEKDYIFIPVNYNLHWSLIVICHPGEVVKYNDETNDEPLKVPCILHMDSIRGSHSGLKDLVQSYLLEEWKERQKDTPEDVCSKFLNLRFLSLELPQQENCSDCGLFLLHYAELFIAEAPANFSPFMINKFDNFLKPDWFMPAEASIKRVHIQRLIYELLENRSSGSASPSSDHESHSPVLQQNNENDNGIEIISEKRNPEKAWNGSLSYSQSLEGMEIGMLDVSLCRTPQCINGSGLGMRELLDPCQQYDQGPSFEQLGCPMPSIREERDEEVLLADPAVDVARLQPMDGMASGICNIGYSSREFGEGFLWNTELSDPVESKDEEGNSSPVSTSSDDSEEMTIIERDTEQRCASSDQVESKDEEGNSSPVSTSSDNSEEMTIIEQDTEQRCASSDQKEISLRLKEKMDSLTESFASASSDVMETPAEDSQELDTLYDSNDQENPPPSNPEEVHQQPEQQGMDKNENDDEIAGVDEQLVVQDTASDDSDEEQPAKRQRLSPSLDEESGLARSSSRELSPEL